MSHFSERYIPTSIFFGICFSLAAILLGFLMGGAFGFAEDNIKESLNDSGNRVLESVYQSDVAAKDAVVKKSWEYLKRAHMHWGAIGTAALAAILALILTTSLSQTVRVVALLLGAGALIYPLYWLCAGIAAPGLGSMGAAKEQFSFLGMPGAAFCILGQSGALFCVVCEYLKARSRKNNRFVLARKPE